MCTAPRRGPEKKNERRSFKSSDVEQRQLFRNPNQSGNFRIFAVNLDAKSMVAKFHAPNFPGVKKVALPSDPYFDCKDKKDLEGSFPYSPTTQLLPGFISGAKERNFLASSPTFRSFLILNGPRGRLRSHEGYESHLIISVIEGRASPPNEHTL